YPHRPFRWYSGIIEIPILNEYTWRGARDHEPQMLALMRADVAQIVGESPIVVILLHTHGIEHDLDYAIRMVDSLRDRAAELGPYAFATLRDLAASGAVDRAVTVEGPDILAI